MRTSTLIAGTGLILACVSFGYAEAQVPATPDRAPLEAQDCQRSAGSGPSETTGSASLSDQLSQSKGIICPPAGVDPGISAPAVGGGRMPVIPPPGTPGGDPTVVPK